MLKKVGIIGGMGPMATVDLMEKIIHMTRAATDQEHIHILTDCNTAIPDRTAAILAGGEDPVPEIVRSALRLEAMGAEVLAMACNTAHYFYDRIQPYIRVPMLHMIRETAAEAKRLGLKTVGLLATSGTLRAGIYDQPFDQAGIEVLRPSVENEQRIMELIYKGVKMGDDNFPPDGIHRALESYKALGAQAMVLACTELPLAFEKYKISERTLDPTEIMARRLVEFAGGEVRRSV